MINNLKVGHKTKNYFSNLKTNVIKTTKSKCIEKNGKKKSQERRLRGKEASEESHLKKKKKRINILRNDQTHEEYNSNIFSLHLFSNFFKAIE